MLKCVLLHIKLLELLKIYQTHVLREKICVHNFSGMTFRNWHFRVPVRREKVTSGSVFGRQDVWRLDKWMAYYSLQLRTLRLEMLNLRVIFAMRQLDNKSSPFQKRTRGCLVNTSTRSTELWFSDTCGNREFGLHFTVDLMPSSHLPVALVTPGRHVLVSNSAN